MNRTLPTIASLSSVFTFTTHFAVAQCPLDPTVVPTDLILCPNSEGVLSTQVYDAYQWYKEGVAIPGATEPTLTVDAFNDAAYSFSVEATLAGCTEISPEVLVDGWAFLPPTAMTSDNYLYIDAGTAIYCAGDTAMLILMQPYTINIQWTNNGVPIPGATDDTLRILQPGNFSVSGAPSICPDFQQFLGVTVPVDFIDPIQPVISQTDEGLCVTPAGNAYQWYYNLAPLAGSNSACIDAADPGLYTVSVVYDPDCSVQSEAYLITGIDEGAHEGDLQVGPNPATDRIAVSTSVGTIGPWSLMDATGRVVRQGQANGARAITVEVDALGAGAYWLHVQDRAPLKVIVQR